MPGTRIKDEDWINIDPKYICPHCHLLLRDPKQSTQCGHLFCRSCVDTLLDTNPKCPEDGEELIAEKTYLDNFRRRELHEILLHCVNPGCSWYSTYKELEENHMKDCQHSLKKSSSEGLSQEAGFSDYLRCENPGCPWQSTCEKLEGHSKICEHALIKCVRSECQTKLRRSQLGKHLKDECQHRNVKCEHCGKDVQIASMKEHVDFFCEDAPVTCNYCKETVMRRDLETHDCVNQSGIGEVQDVQPIENQIRFPRLHFNNGLITLVSSLIRLVFTILTLGIPPPDVANVTQNIRDNIVDICSHLSEKFVSLIGYLTGLERRIETVESSDGDAERKLKELKIKWESLRSEIDYQRERKMRLERQLRDKMSIINGLQSRLDQIDEALALNTVKITDMESQRDPRHKQDTIHSYNGTLLWKIESYQRKRQDAINALKTALYSPPFYSAQYGYKMCAKIYMNGDGFGKGSHLSLFFVVMRGDYDALQTWPFQKKITMMLLDQGNGDHMIDAFHSDPQSSSFQRPKSDMNIASGSPLFMPLDSLNNRQYIKDDVMFIKVIID